ncbi:hypothetical protein [Xanthovirga aplysinae]|uniref:hypothetical protein n=1 Tax=Xanthovirga aplysinae TaxID=2529853 RepID=UPI0012BC63C8|nr:hypothetical protein [Xanthovirga aplysinae]MTI33023.1 hypothetical protein [Xanthovirga aplysinae]
MTGEVPAFVLDDLVVEQKLRTELLGPKIMLLRYLNFILFDLGVLLTHQIAIGQPSVILQKKRFTNWFKFMKILKSPKVPLPNFNQSGIGTFQKKN